MDIHRHLWCLCEEAVILTLFSHKVPDATKAEVARKLLDSPKDIGLGKPGFSEHVGQQTQLEDFVGQHLDS